MKICNETHNQIIDSVVDEEREEIQHGRVEFCDTWCETEQLSIVFFLFFSIASNVCSSIFQPNFVASHINLSVDNAN